MAGLVRESDDLSEVDTAPWGVYPNEATSFGGDDGDDLGDPQRFLDQPWDEFDIEAEADRPLEPLSLTGVELEDTSTFAHWLQSALKALVEPDLGVDGRIGPRTRLAVKRFQQQAATLRGRGPALAVDGKVGPKTIAALEELTATTAPTATTGPDGPPDHAPPVAIPPSGLSIREEVKDGVTEYVIGADGQEVRFSYWTPDYARYKPYCVSRYKGARRGLVTDPQILAAGYSRSELKILAANALKESGGAFGAINTWDNQIVSWGMAQFAGHAGTLAALLAELKSESRSRDAFARWFLANGIDVAHGDYPWKDRTATGYHVVVTTPEGPLRGDPGWQYIRTQPRLIGAFLLAGNDPALQLGQILFWRRAFLSRAIRKRIGVRKPEHAGAEVRRYLTAERSLAIVVRLYNWMPAYVCSWCDRFLDQLAAEHPDWDVYDPASWDRHPDLERILVERIAAERKRVKSGSYDTYALDLSRARGSFGGGRAD